MAKRGTRGRLAFGILLLVFGLDILFSKVLLPFRDLEACCKPSNHIEILLAIVGVAVTFVLTYLSALAALPPPGIDLLRSALKTLPVEFNLAALDGNGSALDENLNRISRFMYEARDSAPNDPDVQASAEMLATMLALANKYDLLSVRVEVLQKLGYSSLRARFLQKFVLPQDAERRGLLYAMILCALVFFYSSGMDALESIGVMPHSVFLLLGYPIGLFIGLASAVALVLRMWPVEVDPKVVLPLSEELTRVMRRKIDIQIEELDDFLVDPRVEAEKWD